MSEDFAREMTRTVTGAELPVRCPVCPKTYHFDHRHRGLPNGHEQYFCEHVWWCNVCVMWCSPDRQCGHPNTTPHWGRVVDRDKLYHLYHYENLELRALMQDLVKEPLDETLIRRAKELLGEEG